MGFDFEKMIVAFEAVSFADWNSGEKEMTPARLPIVDSFLAAMCEMALLFDHLGGGFAFVRRDLSAKIAILRSQIESGSDLTDVVGEESKAMLEQTRSALPTPNSSRTLLRLMWATDFLDVLMRELGVAFDVPGAVSVEPSVGGDCKTLRDCVTVAYNSSLADHHGWAIRRGVGTAVYLLPTKEVFADKVGVDLERRDEFFLRITQALSPIVSRMFAFYKERELLELA